MKRLLPVFVTMLTLLFASTKTWAQTQFISEVMLIGKNNKTEANALKEQYVEQGWTAIEQDLNAGCGSGSDYIYLLYKTRTTTSPNHTFITDFYISDESDYTPESLYRYGRRYKLVPYDGDDHFKEKRGDLNSNAGGKDIHLYYTTQGVKTNNSAITSITFNETQSDAVGGYDLNEDAGGDYIYMHCEKDFAPYWEIEKSTDGGRCIVKSFIESVAVTKSKILAFPAIIDGSVVVDINGVSFSDFTNLETIYFSQGYTYNSMPVADGLSSLKHVHVVDNSGTVVNADALPASITSIPAYGFKSTGIENLTMPSVTSIGVSAFESCKALTSVTMPKVKSIGDNAFSFCTCLPSVSIPSSVTTFGNEAFSDCTSLTSLTLTDGLTSIGDNAFCNTGLTSVTIPSSVTSIGNNAFSECTSLTSLTLTNGLTSIGEYAFYNCTSLSSVTIPSSVTSIGNNAFYDCTSLSSLTLTDGLTTIGNCAFLDCTRLSSLTIPSSVTSIGEAAFYNCTSLSSLTLTDGLTTIGNDAFCNTGLTSVTIPSSVTIIGSYAFSDCTSLSSVTIYAPSLTTYGYSAFELNPSGRKIYVLGDCVNTYQTRWSAYASAIEAIPDPAALATTSAEGANWSTYYNGYVNVQVDANTTVYKVAFDGFTVTLTDTGSKIIKAGEAVVLCSTASGITLAYTSMGSTGDYSDNSLLGSNVAVTQERGYTYYALANLTSGLGFYKVGSGVSIPANNAYLRVAGESWDFFGFDGKDTSGLKSIDNGQWIIDNCYYDLNGRRVINPKKGGIYIHNGKKVFNR